ATGVGYRASDDRPRRCEGRHPVSWVAGNMMTALRRFLVLIAVMFWQGGFTFYGAVVIHVGHQVLESRITQGLITHSVTNYLNVAGVVALILWAWDLASVRDPSRLRQWTRAALLPLLLLTMAF